MAVEAKPMWTRRRRCSRGLTLIEIMIALSMLAIITMALTSSLMTSMNLQQVNKEMEVAMYVAQSAIDSIRAYPDFDKIYVAFNANKGDDPPVPLASVWSPPDFAAMMLDPTDPNGQRQILDGGQVRFLFPGPDNQTVLEENPTGVLVDWSLLGMQHVVNLDNDPFIQPGRNLDGDKDPTTDPPQAGETAPGDSTADPSWKYEMLPVMVRVSWNSRILGDMTTELRTIIAKK